MNTNIFYNNAKKILTGIILLNLIFLANINIFAEKPDKIIVEIIKPIKKPKPAPSKIIPQYPYQPSIKKNVSPSPLKKSKQKKRNDNHKKIVNKNTTQKSVEIKNLVSKPESLVTTTEKPKEDSFLDKNKYMILFFILLLIVIAIFFLQKRRKKQANESEKIDFELLK